MNHNRYIREIKGLSKSSGILEFQNCYQMNVNRHLTLTTVFSSALAESYTVRGLTSLLGSRDVFFFNLGSFTPSSDQ